MTTENPSSSNLDDNARAEFWIEFLDRGLYAIRLKKPWKALATFFPARELARIQESLGDLLGVQAPVPVKRLHEHLNGMEKAKRQELSRFLFENQGLLVLVTPSKKSDQKRAREQTRNFVEGRFTSASLDDGETRLGYFRDFLDAIQALHLPGTWKVVINALQEIRASLGRFEAHLNILRAFDYSTRKLRKFADRVGALASTTDSLLDRVTRLEETNAPPEIGPPARTWYDLARVKNDAYVLGEVPPYVAALDVVPRDLVDALRAVGDAVTITGVENALPTGLDSLDEARVRLYQEAWYLLVHCGVLQLRAPGTPTPVSTQKALALHLNDALHAHVATVWEDLGQRGVVHGELPDKMNHAFPRLARQWEDFLDASVQSAAQDREFSRARAFLRRETESFQDFFARARALLAAYPAIFGPLEPIVEKFRDALQLSERVLVEKNTQLHQYLSQLEREIELDKLRGFVDAQIAEINEGLKTYERHTARLLTQNIPAVDEVATLLDQFRADFLDTNAAVLARFKSYSDKALDIFPVVKNWEETYKTIRGQVKLVVSSLLTQFVDQFRPLLEKERSFFANLAGDQSIFETLPLKFTLDVLDPAQLQEPELRDRLKQIDDKVAELEKILDLYRLQRAKYAGILSDLVREKEGISATTCVVCHEKVDFARDEILKCPHCGCISHRLCTINYIEKHNNCPVCNNAYLVPDGSIYDDTIDWTDENLRDIGREGSPRASGARDES